MNPNYPRQQPAYRASTAPSSPLAPSPSPSPSPSPRPLARHYQTAPPQAGEPAHPASPLARYAPQSMTWPIDGPAAQDRYRSPSPDYYRSRSHDRGAGSSADRNEYFPARPKERHGHAHTHAHAHAHHLQHSHSHSSSSRASSVPRHVPARTSAPDKTPQFREIEYSDPYNHGRTFTRRVPINPPARASGSEVSHRTTEGPHPQTAQQHGLLSGSAKKKLASIATLCGAEQGLEHLMEGMGKLGDV